MASTRIRRSADRAQLSTCVHGMLAAAQRILDEEQQALYLGHSIKVFAPEELAKFKTFWSTDHSDGGVSARKILKTLEQSDPCWLCGPVPTDAVLRELADNFPNFANAVEYVRRAAGLVRLAPGGPLYLAPLLLDGPPGVGKSAFARALAATLQTPMLHFSMTQATASFGLGGLNAQYSGGGPGYLVRSLIDGGAPDVVVIVDELDKAAVDASHDPTLPLYELLEASTAARYVDDGLRMPLNLSGLRWICTSNNASLIAEPLLSRCMLFEIAAPTLEQMRSITAAVYRDIVAAGDWAGHFDPEPPRTVVEVLVDAVPRDLTRMLRSALGAAALAGRSTIRVADLPTQRRAARPRIGFF